MTSAMRGLFADCASAESGERTSADMSAKTKWSVRFEELMWPPGNPETRLIRPFSFQEMEPGEAHARFVKKRIDSRR